MPNASEPNASAGKKADAETTADRLDHLVERWFFDCFNGSVVARSTETWNHVHGAKDELKRRLAIFLADAAID